MIYTQFYSVDTTLIPPEILTFQISMPLTWWKMLLWVVRSLWWLGVVRTLVRRCAGESNLVGGVVVDSMVPVEAGGCRDSS